MYKALVSDMDGTFLSHDFCVAPSNFEAIKILREKGVLFIPSSGRDYESIHDNFLSQDLKDFDDSYIVSYNGSTINRFNDPLPLIEHHLPRDIAEALWAFGIEHHLCMHAYTPDCKIIVREAPAVERAFLAPIRQVEMTEARTLDAWPVVSKHLFMSEDMQQLHDLEEEIVELVGDAADVTYSSRRYLELNPRGINKGTGLIRLCTYLGLDPSEVIALGDSANDKEMIEAAGLGIGVANVDDITAPFCDVILEHTGAEGALMEIVERFFS